ncbi:lipopolysaccharide assembly protein LapB [Mizugakiibacter sediminis]|uniref:Lipopolysaccharide assembly protein B n=2 Tax=Mizugakiibacter sediminis TaxID=1475481 RepID=A0A0S6YYM2_9GAMM|nr:lipopolysaccharide assembly protein LapB [Mizugakiibacter sediminis]
MTPMYVLLCLLLPVAAWSGWLIGRRSLARSSGARVNELSSSYFRGLNYLLNEQQDKAIEVFLQLAEFNRDTVETHLALGNLFRRRGEVERAIRVHQHLIARPNLSDREKTVALLELGEDYMRAGLLDRAETLFSDLVAMNAHAPSALKHLIAIYQHERDWHKAIDHARRLEQMTGESQAAVIAQFYCELAEQSRTHGARAEAHAYLDQAFASQPDCVRAHLICGHLRADEGDHDGAIEAFERAARCDVEFVPEILPPLLDCYARAQRMARAEAFLTEILERYQGISPVLALTRLYAGRDGERAAIDFLTHQLRQRPSVRGLMALIDATLDKTTGEARENFLILRDLTRKLLEGQAMYRCSKCGFGAKAHHWQCPSCKSWGSVRPIHGVANE